MNRIDVPVGISDFEEIRRRNCYYIDKTGLIEEILCTTGTKVTLFTRPRRFGKTLGMSMLAQFFDIRKDSRELFEGLKINKNQELCEKWMNKYPVIYFSFKDIDGLEFETAYGKLEAVIAELYKSHYYLKDSEKLNEFDKDMFYRIAAKKADPAEVTNSLFKLTHMLKLHYGKPVILLLDEYDVPVAKANTNGYYEQMLDAIRGILSTVLKDNVFLEFAVITGCLRITKESIFTGLNNLTTDTISDSRYDEYFGFTHEEVRQLLKDAELEDKFELVQRWYDGYHFGDMDIYCPWDVLNYVNKAVIQGIVNPENFWEHTSDNAVIKLFLDQTDFDVTEKFETLLSGGYIKEEISENLTYNFLTSSEANLWSLLYMTGYLTKVKPEDMEEGDKPEGKQIALRIPNTEVMDIFRKSVVEWFNKKAAGSDRREFFEALWSGDAKKLTELLSDLLFDTISYHDYAESFYHAFVTGLVASAGYIVESNYENGLGRSDIVIKDRRNRRAVAIEAKIASSEDRLETECQNAINQIEENQYARKIERSGFRKVVRYGIAFYKKECLVKSVNE
ncbi:MAG: AAA family ATPase [Eubacteriales bacterium]|nr:AAA family ATPase [Eubacteriales bacterium]